jgi:hypothetical protein
MTISSTTRIAGPYIGAGTTATVPFTFKVFSASDIEVVQVVVSTGAQTTLTLTTDYTVALNGNQNTNPGGSITLVAGNLPTGTNLVITSNVLNLQPTDLTNQGGFYPEVINDSLDRATIQIQQLNDTAQNAVHAPVTDGALAMTLPSAGIRANKFLAFGATGLPVASDGTTTPAITSGGDITLTANDAGSNVNRDIIFVDNTTERMRLTGANGRLGIGTATPAVALDVVGAAAVSGNMTVTGAAAVSGNLTVDTTTLVVDATNNRVGIANATPAVALDVTGAASVSGNLTVDTTTLVVDAANNRVGIGTATPAVALEVTGSATVSSTIKSGAGTIGTSGAGCDLSPTGTIRAQATSGNAYEVWDSSSGTASRVSLVTYQGGAIFATGRINALSGTGNRAVYSDGNGILTNSSSDQTLKESVENIADGPVIVSALRPVRFNWIDTARFGYQREVGLIAQEVQAVLPEVVGTNNDGTLTVDYPKIVSVLISAVQSLQQRVAALEAGA